MPYTGRTRVFSVAATAEGPFDVIGRQTEGSPEGEREEIDAGHKFSNFNDVLPGQMSGTISVTVQDMDGEDDPGQETIKTSYANASQIYIREEKWDGNDPTTLEPVRQTSGYVLTDPLGRDLPMDELATAELEITRNSRWSDVVAEPVA